jgi:hypothetical protein
LPEHDDVREGRVREATVAEAWETALTFTESAVSSPPKRETDATEAAARPMPRPSSTVARVPASISPTVTAPLEWVQPTSDAIA